MTGVRAASIDKFERRHGAGYEPSYAFMQRSRAAAAAAAAAAACSQ